MSFAAEYSGRKYCSTPNHDTSLPMLLTSGSSISKVSLKKRKSKKKSVKRTVNKFEEHNSIANVSENVILQDSDSEYDQQKSYLVDISADEHSLQQKCNFDNVARNNRMSQKFEFDNELPVERLSLEVEDSGMFENAKSSLFADNDSKENDIGLFHSMIEASDNFYDNSCHDRTPEQVRHWADEITQNNSLSFVRTARTTWHSHHGRGESNNHQIKTYTKAIGINRSKAKSCNVTFLRADNDSSWSSDEDCEILKYVEPDPSFKSLSVVANMLWDEFVDDEPLIDKHRAVEVIKQDKKQAKIAKNRKGKENNEKMHIVRERNSSIAGSSKEVDLEEIIFPRRENDCRKKHLSPGTLMKQDFETTAIDPYEVGDNMKQVTKLLNCSPRKKPKVISSIILPTKYRIVTKQK